MAYNPQMTFSDSAVMRYPLKASEVVSQGDFMVLDIATGFAEVATNAAGKKFLGCATESVTAAQWTAAGATSGNISIQVGNGGQVVDTIAVTGSGSTGIIADADIGKVVFATSGTAATVLGGLVPVGILVPISEGQVILTTGGYGAYTGTVTSHLTAVQLFEATGAAANPVAGPFSYDWNYTAAQIANGDLVTTFPLGALLGGGFVITGFTATVTTALTATGATAALNIEIGTTNLTGGVLTITFADHATKGTVVSSTAITGNNSGTAASTISIEASAVTTFTAGQVTLTISGYKTGA